MGLPKVASTFLQQEIFPNLTNLRFHRKRRFMDYKELFGKQLTQSHLFSFERDRDLESMTEEIVSQFPDAKFIILVRRQDKWILSRYKYYIRKHGWKRFDAFFNLESNQGEWKKEELFFQKKIETVEKLANTKPLVLTHDLLKTNPDEFYRRICAYTNSKLNGNERKNAIINKAFSEKQLIVLRKFNTAYRYHKATTSFRFINRIHYKYREFLLHIVAFLSPFIPGLFIREKTFLKNAGQLENIRYFYKDDWDFCKAYAEKNKP
ncbi:MAG: sulfotransferase [Bacteroidota bacterium]